MSTTSQGIYILPQWDDTCMSECLEPSATEQGQGSVVGANYSRGVVVFIKVMREAFLV